MKLIRLTSLAIVLGLLNSQAIFAQRNTIPRHQPNIEVNQYSNISDSESETSIGGISFQTDLVSQMQMEPAVNSVFEEGVEALENALGLEEFRQVATEPYPRETELVINREKGRISIQARTATVNNDTAQVENKEIIDRLRELLPEFANDLLLMDQYLSNNNSISIGLNPLTVERLREIIKEIDLKNTFQETLYKIVASNEDALTNPYAEFDQEHVLGDACASKTNAYEKADQHWKLLEGYALKAKQLKEALSIAKEDFKKLEQGRALAKTANDIFQSLASYLDTIGVFYNTPATSIGFNPYPVFRNAIEALTNSIPTLQLSDAKEAIKKLQEYLEQGFPEEEGDFLTETKAIEQAARGEKSTITKQFLQKVSELPKLSTIELRAWMIEEGKLNSLSIDQFINKVIYYQKQGTFQKMIRNAWRRRIEDARIAFEALRNEQHSEMVKLKEFEITFKEAKKDREKAKIAEQTAKVSLEKFRTEREAAESEEQLAREEYNNELKKVNGTISTTSNPAEARDNAVEKSIILKNQLNAAINKVEVAKINYERAENEKKHSQTDAEMKKIKRDEASESYQAHKKKVERNINRAEDHYNSDLKAARDILGGDWPEEIELTKFKKVIWQ